MFHLFKRAAAGVAAAAAGKVRLFVDTDGLPKTRDEAGLLTVLGNGITNIALVGTVGLVKTYRITRQDGTTFDYTVTDGANGVVQSVNGISTTNVVLSTDDIAEDGSPLNLYFTNERAQDAVGAAFAAGTTDGAAVAYNDAGNAFNVSNTDKGSVAVAAHEAAGDPHPQYLTPAEGDALFTTPAEATSIANGAVAAHVALPDPHTQYTTTAEAAAAAPVQSVVGSFGLSATTVSGVVTILNKLAQGNNVFFATDYGTLVSGSDTATVAGAQADANTATIQAAINAASSAVSKKPGGIVLLPAGTFHISSQLNISTSAVLLMGAGAYSNSDSGNQTGFGTALFWNNTASGSTVAMVKVFSPVNAGGPAVKRAGIEGITLQCAGNVGRGLYVESIHYGQFKDIYVVNATNQGVFATCLITGTQLGEAADNTKCVFENISVRMIEAGASATGIRLDGVANANTSNSTFRNIAVLCTGAQIALDCGNTDSNHFYSIVINQVNGSTVQPVRMRGGTAAGLESRGNVFFYLAAGGSSTGVRGMYNEGTEIGGVVAPAKNNAVFGYSIENGEPYPIIGTGATLFYQIVGGTQPFKLNSAHVTDTAFTNTAATVATLNIPANALVPGTTFDITASGSAINTTAASNLVVDILVNGVAVAPATLALGTVAAAAPGRGFWFQGSVTFRTVGAAGTVSASGMNEVAALGAASNQTAATAVNTTTTVTLALRIGTSAATSTGTIRQATIIQGN